MSRKLFGTDGIRGRAYEYPIVPEVAFRLGQVVAREFGTAEKNVVVIGRDTRQSGPMLEQALAEGVMDQGGEVALLGVLPTPGVAVVSKQLHAAAGVVISASHNPFEDNGLKVFQGDGWKCDDALEARLEAGLQAVEAPRSNPVKGRQREVLDAAARYREVARASLSGMDLRGVKIAVDCANGAACHTTPETLRELGAEVIVIHDRPDGQNINRNCGSTHPEEIQALVRATGAQIGLSHDGDADRLICSDETGAIVDGDEILAMVALDHLQRGALAGKTLVATVMSNLGLDEAVEKAGGRVLRTAVGDRYVLEAMRAHGLNVGGEQSGHLIFRDYATTGDGLIAALQVLRVMKTRQLPLSVLRGVMAKYPQTLLNLKVREKIPLEQLPEIQTALGQAEKTLNGAGRVLLRYSGTEAKIRLLVEAREEVVLQSVVAAMRSALEKALDAR
jgi:phosphoglucosamine mutase